MDGTVGAGGHSSKILPRIQPEGRLIGLDRDPMMLAFAKEKLALVSPPSSLVSLIHSSYVDLAEVLKSQGLTQIDRLLVDLGLSSDQLSDRERGFGFDAGGPLDMRFDTRGGSRPPSSCERPPSKRSPGSSETGVRSPPPTRSLRRSSRIASSIPWTQRPTVRVVEKVLKVQNPQGSHPATRVFQALRIHVNRELDQLVGSWSTCCPPALSLAVEQW